MTAKIIRLEQFNVGCRHHANGIRFPHIYRVTGFEFDLVDDQLVVRFQQTIPAKGAEVRGFRRFATDVSD